MRRCFVALAAIVSVFVAAPAHAAAPAARIPFSTAVPLPSGTYFFRFSLWDTNGVKVRGAMLWSEQKRLAVTGIPAGSGYRASLRHVLGSVNPLAAPVNPPSPPVDFSRQLWVQVAYRTASTRPWRAIARRTPLATAPYALWSARSGEAANADTVDGLHASELGQQTHTHDGADIAAGTVADGRIDAAIARDAELEAHASRTDNPHLVTAAQAGAAAAQHAHDESYYSKAYVDGLEARLAALESANLSLESRLAALEAANAAVAAVLEHFSHAETAGIHTVVVSGANLQVVDGSGDTAGAVNGMGNVIIGYNALRGGGEDSRTGSHNLVAGDQNNYSSFGGIVAGQLNAIANSYASVSGGALNTASGPNASVSGGAGNSASGPFASVSGGGSNTASGANAAVSGGSNNHATGTAAAVSGGSVNFASGKESSVGGGYLHNAAGEYDWRAGSLLEDQ